MIIYLVEFFIGAIFLYYGAELLILGSRILAKKFNISPVLVGITLVAFGTSLPELIVSFIAIAKGDTGFVIGNVIGSNIANIGLVLGTTSIIIPIYISYRKIKYDLYFLLFITLLLLIFIYNSELGILQGLIFILLLMPYCWYLYKKNNIIDDNYHGDYKDSYWPLSIKILAGIVGLGLGANLFVLGAKGIAIFLGVPSIVIGMSIVAIGTSLPELATSISAARYNQSGLIIGNIIGSNIINIIVVLGVTIIYRSIDIKFSEIIIQGNIIFALTILLPVLLRIKGGISRNSGLLLLFVYLLFLYLNFNY